MINSKIILLDDVGFEYFECASNHDGARIANFWTRRLSRKSSSLVWLYSSSTQATCPRKKHHIWGQIWLWVFQSQITKKKHAWSVRHHQQASYEGLSSSTGHSSGQLLCDMHLPDYLSRLLRHLAEGLFNVSKMVGQRMSNFHTHFH